MAATWADNNEAMTQLSQLAPGGEYGSWDRPIDVALGGIGSGESWSKAAQGAYDGRWRQSLTKLRTLWGARSATVYIRFAHEMNANWYPWAVNAGNHQDFIAAWKRFRALQQEIFPSSQLVFCVNRESVGTSIDWRKTFPGAQYVDVMGVDYYNQYPYVASSADFASSLGQKDGYGAPKGLQQHLDFARSVGLPLSLPEWSGIGTNGDSPAFIEGMYNFFRANAGAGAGQLLYEVQFNVGMSGGRFQLYAGSQMPASAEAYRRLF
ncbi:glycosyl hydrolase [Modestobacter sp. SYSU DS0657]